MNRSRSKYDITLDDGTVKLGFVLAHELGRGGLPARPAVVTSELSPARLDEVVRNADVPRVVDNLDAGMGYSRRVEVIPNGYAYTLPGYTRAPGGIFSPAGKLTEITMPSPGSWTPAWIVGSERFGDVIYLMTNDRYVLRLSSDGLTASVEQTFPAGFTCVAWAVFNNRLYVAGGTGLAYKDGVTGVWSAVANVPRAHLAAVNWRPLGVPTEVLVGVSPEFNWNALRWCPITADPMVPGNWSAPVRIGSDERYLIHNLVAAPRHVYALRPNGVWDMDELGARAFNVAPWVAEGVDHFNGAWGMHLGDGLYYSHSQGLCFVPTTGEAQYRPDWCQPGWGLPYEGPVRGQAMAGTLHNGWGLVGLWDVGAVQSYVCAGRRDDQAASGPGAPSHVWHGAEAIVPGLLQHMRVYTRDWANDWPQLLLTTTDGSTPPTQAGIRCFWQSLSKSGTPLQELLWGGGFVPESHASLFLPADPYDRPSSVKTMLQFDMVTERLNPGSDTLKVYAGADGAAMTEQGTADAGTFTALAPLELTEGRYIAARVDALGSPILRSLALRAAVGVELREARSYQVVLGYDDALRTPRGRETRDPERRAMDLRAMVGRVVTLEDEVPMRVRVLQVMAPERRQIGAPGREGAWAVTVPILVSILDHPFRYDATAPYDASRTWS